MAAPVLPSSQDKTTSSAPPEAAKTTLSSRPASSSQPHKILVLPGDHAGPEVMDEALKVLSVLSDATGIEFAITQDIVGGCSIDRHGTPITDAVLAKAKESDAVLFGSVGGPEWGTTYPNPESGLLRLRAHLGAFANIRPCTFYSQSLLPLSPLKAGIARGTDFVVLRENCGGAYFGPKVERDDYASDTWEYTRDEIVRCARVAGALARTMGSSSTSPALVTSSDKANVLASGRLWRKVVTETFRDEFPDIPLKHQLADSLSMLMLKDPRQFNGVILTDNTFGDMLSDQAGGVVGTLGVLPSASLCAIPGADGKCNGIYEPVHGSAPDIAGQGKVNPTAQILSLALMLRYSFNMLHEADAIEKAVEKVLDGSDIGGLQIRTADLGGTASTREVGDAVCKVLQGLLNTTASGGAAKLGDELHDGTAQRPPTAHGSENQSWEKRLQTEHVATGPAESLAL